MTCGTPLPPQRRTGGMLVVLVGFDPALLPGLVGFGRGTLGLELGGLIKFGSLKSYQVASSGISSTSLASSSLSSSAVALCLDC